MSAPRYRTSSWRGHDNYECNRCKFSTMDRGEMVVHVRGRHPTDAELARAPARDALDGVPFASPQAVDEAQAARLGAHDFDSRVPTGVGGFTVDDVRVIAQSTTPEER